MDLSYERIVKFMRFGVVGALSGAVYCVVTYALFKHGGLRPGVASICGYLAAIPANFLGQRWFAFRAQGSGVRTHMMRFALVSALSIAQSFVITELSVMAFGPKWGLAISLALVVFTVPFITFFALERFVFRSKPQVPAAVLED